MGLLKALGGIQEIERIQVLTNPSQDYLKQTTPSDIYQFQSIKNASKGKLGRMMWDQSGVYSKAKKSKCDWLFLPKGFLSFVRKPPIKTAAYVHDTIHQHYAIHYPDAVSKLESTYFTKAYHATVKNADVILTNSEFTAGEVQQTARSLNIPEPLIIPVGIGFEPETSQVRTKDNRIVVLTGRFPHKKTKMIIEFMNQWQYRTGSEWIVDWIGSLPEGISLPHHKNWIKHKRLPDAEFSELMRRSRILVFSSDYEGFGMPPIEALLLGSVPVFSSIPATLEVMENMGCPFINDDVESFMDAMSQATTVEFDQLDSWEKEILQKYNWKKVAQRAFQALKAE